MISFPDGFVWGTASAAHQVEGGNVNNDWWAWEHDPRSPCVEPSGDANDHYHRYEDDFELLSSFGHNAHRLSIEWSRIEPEPDEFSNAALDHYARVLDALQTRGMTPFVTLHHFTSPRWLGTWLRDDIADRFRRFAEIVARRLGPRIPFCCTINEPQVVAQAAYRHAFFPPGIGDPATQGPVTRNFLAAHAAALEAFKEHSPSSQVGLVVALTDHQAVDEASVPTRDRIHHWMCGVYLDALRDGWVRGLDVADEQVASLGGTSDFVGVNYYTRARIDASASPRTVPPPAGAETTQMGYEVVPDSFVTVLREAGELGLPVYVTENGIGTSDDRRRIRFLDSHLRAVRRAIDAGVDVRGYLHWCAVDNFEWAFGYQRTFGLIACDRETFERTPKPSAHYFGEIVAANGLDPGVTDRYLSA